ncbi:DUF983 domain-containing protein [Erythrobacter mangrovi]|uniref:DUF983 domain-containing protein n=1 Tax=Erythrobacter mangrovi TaxID=2739433 RepID=A0A7D3XK18_9SPHN|nr:DUF983 domain-containing protein [Erythrobacter mangrovi]QKG72399.1 DUF983 domain-containing protein [Erythrobacter mangrovi]
MTQPSSLRPDVTLPASPTEMLLRGLRCQCPRCGEARIFGKWLKPLAHCPACALDLSEQRADDFPAYIAMFVTGHLLAPILVLMLFDWAIPSWVVIATIIPLSIVLMLLLLQPAKGAVIALQWWHGMHGFRRERRPEDPQA